MADGWEREQAERSQRENSRNCIGRILVVGVDRSFGGDDGRDAANRRPDGEQARELGRQTEHSSEISHQHQRQRELDGNAGQADPAHLHYIAQNKPHAEQYNAGLQPEFVSVHAGTKDFGHAGRVGHDQPEDDRPEHVLDVRQKKVMRLAVTGDRLLRQFARVPKNCKQDNPWNEVEETSHRSYHGMLLRMPAFTSRAAASDTRTASQSRLRAGLRERGFVFVMGIRTKGNNPRNRLEGREGRDSFAMCRHV